MENLFRAVSAISLELNKISAENVQNEIKNLKERSDSGDNANFSVSIFQENLISSKNKIKKFLLSIADKVFNWADLNLHEGYEKIATAHHGPELFLGFLSQYVEAFPEDTRSKTVIFGAAD